MRTLIWTTAVVVVVAALAIAGPDEAAENAPKAGDPAPACRLNDPGGKALDLRPWSRGAWTIVAFYPKSFTPG